MLENEIAQEKTFDKVNYLFVSVNTNTGIYRIDKDRDYLFHEKQYLSEDQVILALNTLEKVMVVNKTKSTIITSNFNPYVKESNLTIGSVLNELKNVGKESQPLVTIYLSQDSLNNYMTGEEAKGYFHSCGKNEIAVHIPMEELKTVTREAYEPEYTTIQGKKIY